MEVDPNKVIERLANQNTQQSVQIAALQAQLETVVEAYNKLVSGDSDEEVAEAQSESVAPDEVFSPPSSAH